MAKAPAELLASLRQRLGDRLDTRPDILALHGKDESYHPPAPPDAVAFATSTEEVQEVVRLCRHHRTPLIPFGTGTSLEGGVMAIHGGISVDLSAMNRILRVSGDDLDCTVEAGVTRKQLNHHLRDTGLFFPIDPGADASLGGMASTRASGTNAVRYGTMREAVLGLTAVLADGSVIKTGGRARKSAAGYDLTRLLVGAEGTLGIITELTLRLHGLPEAMAAAVCPYPTLKAAVDTVIQVIQSCIPIARVELLDALQMEAVNRWANFDYPVAPTLFFEFHGSEAGVAEQAREVEAIAAEHCAGAFQWTSRDQERNALWAARHDAYYAALALVPGCKGWPTDVCVPISRLADCIEATQADLAADGLTAPLVGHVGDGNFHLLYLVDPDDAAQLERIKANNDRLVHRALAMGGTCSGEHGVGYGKMEFLEAEHGAIAVATMAAIKRALDPDNLLNPGKMVMV